MIGKGTISGIGKYWGRELKTLPVFRSLYRVPTTNIRCVYPCIYIYIYIHMKIILGAIFVHLSSPCLGGKCRILS